MSIIDSLNEAKVAPTGRTATKMDQWVREHPDRVDDLDEAAEWFRHNRGPNFGWKPFAKTLRDVLPDFPDGWQHLKGWCERRYGL